MASTRSGWSLLPAPAETATRREASSSDLNRSLRPRFESMTGVRFPASIHIGYGTHPVWLRLYTMYARVPLARLPRLSHQHANHAASAQAFTDP